MTLSFCLSVSGASESTRESHNDKRSKYFLSNSGLTDTICTTFYYSKDVKNIRTQENLKCFLFYLMSSCNKIICWSIVRSIEFYNKDSCLKVFRRYTTATPRMIKVLTHFRLFHLYTPENVRKQKVFLTFSEGTKCCIQKKLGEISFSWGSWRGTRAKLWRGL